MKITVDVDCTPEHDAYLSQMIDAVRSGGVSRDAVETMMKSWMPMGEAGLKLWQQLLENVTGAPKR